MPETTNPRRIATLALSLAVFVAPFLALLFSLEAGLGLMAAALLALTYLLREAAASAVPEARARIRLIVKFNLTLAAACIGAIVWLTFGG